MSDYRALLFDFFGTLTRAVERGPWHRSIADSLGCEPDAFLAAIDSSYRARCRGVFGSPEQALRWVCDQLGIDPTPERLRSAARARVAAVRADTRLRPEAVQVLKAARARGLRTAVISDCAYELPAFLPDLSVAPLLDTRVLSVEIGECKPHPAMYAAACDRLAVRPQECLYVGDGGGRELSGATAMGMTAVRLAAPDLDGHLVFSSDHEFRGPSVPSLAGVLRLVDRPVAQPAGAGAGGPVAGWRA